MTTSSKRISKKTPQALAGFIVKTIENTQGINIIVRNVAQLTNITDFMVICSGSSSRHVYALMEHLVEKAKKEGTAPLHIEGDANSGWILIDFGSVIVHIMLPTIREYYSLETLWQME